jgi:hypothetical protein
MNPGVSKLLTRSGITSRHSTESLYIRRTTSMSSARLRVVDIFLRVSTAPSCNSGLHTHKWIRRMRSKDRAHRLRRLTVASRFTRMPKTVNCEGSGESD